MNRILIAYLERKMHGARKHERDHYDHEKRYYDDKEYHHSDNDMSYHKMLELSDMDKEHWIQKMHNTDGTQGEHYHMAQITPVAEKLGIRFDHFDEHDLCITVNMIYSDYGHVIKKYVPAEKELMACIEMAKAFLNDPDGPAPEEKLALYYHCIVDHAE